MACSKGTAPLKSTPCEKSDKSAVQTTFALAMTNASLVPAVIHEVPLQYYVFFATALFCIGVTGVLLRRNAIIIFMCIELMLNAVNILLTAFAAYRADPNGQVFVFFIMAVAAAEVAVGLGIIVMIYRNFQNTDVNLLNRLKW
jgi:NADH-quinone oxidoreductase subunit K